MDRLYVYYEKIRNIVRKRGFLCRLVQGWKVAVVALACYGWWGVIYPELTMLPSTYEIVYEEQAEETKTVQKDAEVVEWNSDKFESRHSDSSIGVKIFLRGFDAFCFCSLFIDLENCRKNLKNLKNGLLFIKFYAMIVFVPGCGSAWLERRLREAEVASSNPATPIHL